MTHSDETNDTDIPANPQSAIRLSVPTRREVARGLSTVGFVGLAGGALSACALDLPGSAPPPRIYVLTPKSTFPEDIPSVDWQLLVETPLAPAGVASTRIALRRDAIELQYFARAAWTDAAPKMVQTLIIESFENSHKIVSVGREAIGLRSDFILKTDLREFQAEYMGENNEPLAPGKPPRVRIRMNAKLVKMPERVIAASQTWEYFNPAQGDTMSDIVIAFDSALGSILKRLVAWTLVEGQRIQKQDV